MYKRQQLHHVAISQRNIKEIMNLKVIRNGEFDSDHYLSKIELKLLPDKVHRKLQKLLKYNTDLP